MAMHKGFVVALVLLSALVLAESSCEEPREGEWDITQSRVNPNDTNSFFNFAMSNFELIKDQEQIYVGAGVGHRVFPVRGPDGAFELAAIFDPERCIFSGVAYIIENGGVYPFLLDVIDSETMYGYYTGARNNTIMFDYLGIYDLRWVGN